MIKKENLDKRMMWWETSNKNIFIFKDLYTFCIIYD